MKRSFVAAILIAFVAACGDRQEGPAPQAPRAPAAPVPDDQTSLPKVDQQALLKQINVLASDEFEGRAPGTKGEDLTVKYLQDQFRQMGLTAGNPDGTYVQKVPLVGITAKNTTPLTIAKGAEKVTFKWGDDVVAWSKHVADSAALDASELVFAGYGVEAPEFTWNDFKDADVKGKTIIVLVNDPPVPDPADASKLDPKTFGGNAMTYYGRWTYKFEEGARKGAAGILVVHETERAGYPFSVVQGNLKEKFDLVTPDKNMGRAAIEGWITLDTAKKILKLAGQNFDALKKQAVTRDFKPVPLGLKASLAIHNTMRTIDSQNVVAKLEGSDPRQKDEYVLYSAHWDHFGVGTPVNGDKIYNGALDNASGVATVLEIARAFTQANPQPKRSILFLMVTAEEQGLLGSQYYSVSPLYPLAKTVANINVDGVNQWGRTKDITVVGLGASDLDDYLRQAASAQGRTLTPDPEPEKGFYYRSDHFNFAKQGVPALDPDAGVNYIGKPAEYGKQKRDEYTNRDYHAPSDEVKPDWDLSGAAEDANLLLTVGYRVANADTFPEWKPGNEFKAKRDAMLRR
ncbi:MAG: peptidase M28 [Acidobacteria bacterium RIFCSPLOWO2_02_FULL_67_36]|nr:MAG: peptidase M28 [Acidobacteria bacterium RIFCSPLOWO2_02_FULL_67_36]OFW25936.1 MAG: peptidase M28 [Acidobacteria bacterium RIFCSPLOWO2_12_FULL_66_21]